MGADLTRTTRLDPVAPWGYLDSRGRDLGSASHNYHRPIASLHRIEYFLAVVEEGSFSAAATRLHVAQSALSRQVGALEDELGVALLGRGPGGARPTPAGNVLADRAPGALADLNRALVEATAVGRGGRQSVVLGYTASAGYATAPLVAERLRQTLPAHAVRTTMLEREALIAAVRDGTVDLGILRCPPSGTRLDLAPLGDEPQGLLASADHPLLAAPDAPALADLRNETILLHPREANPEHHDAIVALCRAAGFEPRLRERGIAFDAAQREIVAGEAVAITGPPGDATPTGLVWRELAPPVSLPIGIVTRPGGAAPWNAVLPRLKG